MPGPGGRGCSGGVPTPGGYLVPGVGAWSGRVCSRVVLAPRGGGGGLPGGDPPGWLLLRAVRILLECILVAQKSTQIGSELRSTAKTGTFTGSCKIIRRRGGVCPKMVQ